MAHMRLKGQRPFLCESALVWCCASLALGLGILWGETMAWAQSDYEIINTGIKGGGCWYDDTHFIVVKGQQPAPGQEFEVEGLYYLDPSKPKDLRRIDLSPIEPSLQRHIRDVTCQDQTILFHVLSADRKRNKLYTLKLGEPPAVLAEKAEGFVVPQAVSIRNQYLLDFTSALGGRDGQLAAMPEQTKGDCRFAYLRDNYHAVCLRHDRGTKQRWLLSDMFLVKYVWDETIRVNKDGAYQWVPNPEPQLKLADGKELKQGYLLRDLENRIVREIPVRQQDYQYDTIHLKVDPQGHYLYCPCWKAGDHGEKQYTVGGRICRFRVDGANQSWEEVVSVQQSPRDPFSLQDVDVNSLGDVVMIERGHRHVARLWKYSALSNSVEKLLQVGFSEELGAPRVSPDGRWVSVMKQSLLVLIDSKGVQP